MTQPLSIDDACRAAADLISQADGLLITAGAGIGIDSGLPDFRGERGFWNAYPALGEMKMRFSEVANPEIFRAMPALAWGFYGHRLQLYRATVPHAGFGMLLDMARSMPHGAFVFTSNVDGHFQKAGFAEERVVECHGSIHHLQCFDGCGQPVWSADAFVPEIDARHCRRARRAAGWRGCSGRSCWRSARGPRLPWCACMARDWIVR
jgi:NAD-dependent SIR2 family protein deacetylase